MPVTIGSQTNVPDTGDPITTPWPKDTANKIVHTFANATARNAWTTRPSGAMCVTTDTDILWQWDGTAWVEIAKIADVALKVAKAGDTMSGQLSVGQDPDVGAGISLETDGRIHSKRNIVDGPNMVLDRVVSGAIVAGQPYINFLRITSTIGSITVASSTSVAYNTTSDRRLKQATGDVADAADIVAALGRLAYRGRWIGDQGQGEEWVFLNSQDVEPLAPWAVQGAADGVVGVDDPAGREPGTIIPQQLDHSALVPLLFAALSQAIDRIAALEQAAP